jgi:hypothetical protein
MENNFKGDFFTKEQLQSIIHVPVYEVISDLDEYIYYDGVLSEIPFDDDYVKSYVVGFIKVKKELAKNQLGKYINNKDGSTKYNYSYICGDYCSRPDLANTTDLMASISFKDNEQEIVYNFSEFKKRCDTIRLPIKNKSEITFIKAFNYDVQLVNQKSNYTLIEASRIAANLSVSPNGFETKSSTLAHYQEVLSDCVKDQHQNKFHLITKELWVHTHDEYEPVSHKYDNGTRLKASANINLELTIISKAEFIRWCSFMKIETGLTNEEVLFEESIEALKLVNEKLKKQIRSQAYQQDSTATPNINNKKTDSLNKEIELLKTQIESLKENSFPIMTTKLKAALAAQNKYWLDYNDKQLPLQKNIQQHIQETLGIELTTDNRLAKSLSVVIQPDKIKRK